MNNQKYTGSQIRQEASSGEVYVLLPKKILSLLKEDLINKTLFQKFSRESPNLSWNLDFGYAVSTNNTAIFVLVVKQSNVTKLYQLYEKYIIDLKDTKNLPQLAINYSNKFLNFIALGSTEYNTDSNLGDFNSNHLSDSPTRIFRSADSNTAGIIRLRSESNISGKTDIVGSAPQNATRGEVDAKKEIQSKAKPGEFLLGTRMALAGAFNRRSDPTPVPSADNNPKISPVLKQMVSDDGQISIYELGPDSLNPIVRAGKGFWGDTARNRQYGTPNVTTVGGHANNPNIMRPSSHFYPKDFWQATVFTSPLVSLFSNPNNIGVIVLAAIGAGIAAASSDDKQFTKNYIKTSSIIDNKEVDKDLYG